MTFQLGPKQTRWLEILETTDQPQAKGYLSCSEGMCCLGVAAVHVLNANSVRDSNTFADLEWLDCFPEADDGVGTELDKEFARTKLGLRDGVGSFVLETLRPDDLEQVKALAPHKKIDCLAQLNDHGWTFKQIAAFIRRNPTAVFTHDA